MALIFKITSGGEIMLLMLETRLWEVSCSIVRDVSLSLSLNVSIILLEIYVVPHIYTYIYTLGQIDIVILYKSQSLHLGVPAESTGQ